MAGILTDKENDSEQAKVFEKLAVVNSYFSENNIILNAPRCVYSGKEYYVCMESQNHNRLFFYVGMKKRVGGWRYLCRYVYWGNGNNLTEIENLFDNAGKKIQAKYPKARRGGNKQPYIESTIKDPTNEDFDNFKVEALKLFNETKDIIDF